MFLYRSPCGKLSLPAAAGGQNILLTASYSLEFSDVLYETSPPLRIFESLLQISSRLVDPMGWPIDVSPADWFL